MTTSYLNASSPGLRLLYAVGGQVHLLQSGVTALLFPLYLGGMVAASVVVYYLFERPRAALAAAAAVVTPSRPC